MSKESRVENWDLGFTQRVLYESSTNDLYQINHEYRLITALGYLNSKVTAHFVAYESYNKYYARGYSWIALY